MKTLDKAWYLFALWILTVVFCVIYPPSMWLRPYLQKSIEIPQGSCNICIGYRAGEDITVESYQFCFTIPEMPSLLCSHGYSAFRFAEYRATMTPEEYAVMMNVVERAKHSWRYLPEKDE